MRRLGVIIVAIMIGVFGLRLGETGRRGVSRRRAIVAILIGQGWRAVAVPATGLGVMLLVARGPIELRQWCRFVVWLSRIAAAAAVGFTLADQAGQFGERIAGALRVAARIRVTAIAARTVVGHENCPVQPFPSTHSRLPRPAESYGNSPHLVRSLYPQQRQPRGKYGDYALYKDEPSQGRFSIILDNEA